MLHSFFSLTTTHKQDIAMHHLHGIYNILGTVSHLDTISVQEGCRSLWPHMPCHFIEQSYTSSDLDICSRPWDPFPRHRRTAGLSSKKCWIKLWITVDTDTSKVWCMLVVLTFRRWKQKDCCEFRDLEFYASLACILVSKPSICVHSKHMCQHK